MRQPDDRTTSQDGDHTVPDDRAPDRAQPTSAGGALLNDVVRSRELVDPPGRWSPWSRPPRSPTPASCSAATAGATCCSPRRSCCCSRSARPSSSSPGTSTSRSARCSASRRTSPARLFIDHPGIPIARRRSLAGVAVGGAPRPGQRPAGRFRQGARPGDHAGHAVHLPRLCAHLGRQRPGQRRRHAPRLPRTRHQAGARHPGALPSSPSSSLIVVGYYLPRAPRRPRDLRHRLRPGRRRALRPPGTPPRARRVRPQRRARRARRGGAHRPLRHRQLRRRDRHRAEPSQPW